LAIGRGKSQNPFIFQIIEIYLNLVDMGGGKSFTSGFPVTGTTKDILDGPVS